MIPVIMAGGAGTRLWPVSRQSRPKPFMLLPDGEMLLAKTVRRACGLEQVSRLITVTNQDYYFGTRDVYADTGIQNVAFDYVLEPIGRNTAPAIAMAALSAQRLEGESAVLLVLAADHLISETDAFAAAVTEARSLAEQGFLVTFGITPDRPETGYGYIQRGDGIEGAAENSHTVKRFVEKPDAETAQNYLTSGDYLWNAGMFCFRADVLLEALRKHAPEVHQAAMDCWQATRQEETPLGLDADSFARFPGISIDYAVMEHADNVAVVACDIGWSDIGSWDAVSTLSSEDEQGNSVVGEAVLVDSENCFVFGEGRMVATVGMQDTMIIDTRDALLVANRSDAQGVKKVVDQLREAGHECVNLHSTVYRPWGTYTILEEGPGFKIKRIVVHPGRELSLQMHHHRSEHWIVVSGTAKVVNGEEEFLVRKNESTYIPAGNRHRLTNPGVIDLVMIEVQSGDYLEEDDIVRFDDLYGRA
ncbi:MAG: mannose-1-phosphate guanylyltransferase/mannose-6-phosphate isomerase [Gammaproteobacteria bacterium]